MHVQTSSFEACLSVTQVLLYLPNPPPPISAAISGPVLGTAYSQEQHSQTHDAYSPAAAGGP
eukprot:2623193-Pleurochrysis_carterae.AAC.1